MEKRKGGGGRGDFPSISISERKRKENGVVATISTILGLRNQSLDDTLDVESGWEGSWGGEESSEWLIAASSRAGKSCGDYAPYSQGAAMPTQYVGICWEREKKKSGGALSSNR